MLSPLNIISNLLKQLAGHQRQALLYILAFTAAAALVSTLSFMSPSTNPGFRLMQFIQLGLFVTGGIAHNYLAGKKLPFLQTKNTRQLVAFSFVVTASIFLTLLVIYISTQANFIPMAFALSGAFLLPVLGINAWQLYNDIPEEQYSPWYPSDVEIDNNVVSLFLNARSVTLRLLPHPSDDTDSEYDLTVPGHKTLGEAFDEMVSANNNSPADTIQLTTKNRKQYGWLFTIEEPGKRKRFLDPLLNLPDNKVHDQTIINATRANEKRPRVIRKLELNIKDNAAHKS